MTAPLVLDTGILVHLVRGDRTGDFIRDVYSPTLAEPRPSYSIVTEAELRSLAILWGWGPDSRHRMEFLLTYFQRIAIDSQPLVQAYALLASHTRRAGKHLSDNDPWIAATAHITERTLLTIDDDFLALTPLFLDLEIVELG